MFNFIMLEVDEIFIGWCFEIVWDLWFLIVDFESVIDEEYGCFVYESDGLIVYC